MSAIDETMKRAEAVQGLRDFADFLEAHPEMSDPFSGTLALTHCDTGPDDQVLAYAKRQADRFRASLERIAFREECADVEAEDMRQAARAVLGWKTLGDRG